MVLLWLCLLPAPALAGGGTIPEMGTRRTAMAAAVGRPDDLSAIYHNPAGLILSPGVNLYLNAGVGLLDLSLSMRPWPGSDQYIKAPVGADGYYPEFEPSIALGVIPMLVGSVSLLDERLVLALGLYFPNAVGAAFDEASVARYHAITSYAVAGSGTLAAAYQLLPSLSVGASVSVVYMQMAARRKLFPLLGGLDLSALVGGESELELDGQDVGFGFSLGLLWQPLPFISVGLAMISRTDLELEGDVTISVLREGQDPSYLSGTQRTELMLPWTFQAGLHVDLTSWLEVGFEWRFWVYRMLDEQRTQVEGLVIIKELVVPKRYSDSFQVSGGVRVCPPQVPGLELMLGWHYDESPAPDQTVTAEQPTFHHVGLHSGVRYRISPRLRLAATFIRYWYLARTVSGSQATPPSNFKGAGGNNILSVVLEGRVGDGW